MITGNIYKLEVQESVPGKGIAIGVWYRGDNTAGSLINPWKVFVACRDNLGNKKMAKDVVIRSATFSDSFSERLWTMPNKTITLEVRLYAHEDSNIAWDWAWWPVGGGK